MPGDCYTPKNAFNLKKAFNHGYTQIYTDTSETYTNKVNHLFGEVFYLFKCLFYRCSSVFIRGQLRFLGLKKKVHFLGQASRGSLCGNYLSSDGTNKNGVSGILHLKLQLPQGHARKT